MADRVSAGQVQVTSAVKEAIINGRERELRRLISQNPTVVNLPIDSDGTSLLHLSANSDNPLIPQLLIDSQANIDCQNSDGWTPLHVAVVNGCTQALGVLLDNGADPHLLDQDDMSPLDHAQEEEQWQCLNILERFVQRREEREEISMCELYVSMVMGNDEDPVATVTENDHTQTLLPSNGDESVICTSNFHENMIGKLDMLTSNDHDMSINNAATILDESCIDTTNYVTATEGSITLSVDCIGSSREQSYECLTNSELRQKLVELGEEPGPVNDHTRIAYLKYLDKLQKGIQPAGNRGYKGFKYELALCLNGAIAVPNLRHQEKALFSEFRVKGQLKTYFNYLLIDSTIVKSLDTTIQSNVSDLELFQSFVEGIFYVGKGKNSRSFQHLKDTKKHTATQGRSKKMEKIVKIWESGEGVLSLHVFNGIAGPEAYNREASIIECIGIENLTNVVRGHYHGALGAWSANQRRRLGLYFLDKAFKAFINDAPQKLFPEDV